jgi:hypothetical protein
MVAPESLSGFLTVLRDEELVTIREPEHHRADGDTLMVDGEISAIVAQVLNHRRESSVPPPITIDDDMLSIRWCELVRFTPHRGW